MKPYRYTIADIHLSPAAKRNVAHVLATNRLTYGPYTQRFERAFAARHGRNHGIFVSSGTAGLQLALETLKITDKWRDGDEVLVPAVTFIATVNAIIHAGLTPVFVDVEPDFYCMNPLDIKRHITPKTRALLPVHLFGQSAAMDNIMSIAQAQRLRVVEDSCETVLVSYKGKPVGSRGDIAVFSTYGAHVITSGVGGIVATNDPRLAMLIRSLSFHGRDPHYLSIDDDDRVHAADLPTIVNRRFVFTHTGHSMRLTEMEAAVGLAELSRGAAILKARKRTAMRLRRAFAPFGRFLVLPKEREVGHHCYMLFPLLIKELHINRDRLLLYLERHGVETRPFFPILSQSSIIKRFGNLTRKYPVAQYLTRRGFFIGCHEYATAAGVAFVGKTIQTFLQREKLLEV